MVLELLYQSSAVTHLFGSQVTAKLPQDLMVLGRADKRAKVMALPESSKAGTEDLFSQRVMVVALGWGAACTMHPANQGL